MIGIERGRSRDRKQTKKIRRLEASEEGRETGDERRRSVDWNRTAKTERSTTIRMRLYRKADPPESEDGGRKR